MYFDQTHSHIWGGQLSEDISVCLSFMCFEIKSFKNTFRYTCYFKNNFFKYFVFVLNISQICQKEKKLLSSIVFFLSPLIFPSSFLSFQWVSLCYFHSSLSLSLSLYTTPTPTPTPTPTNNVLLSYLPPSPFLFIRVKWISVLFFFFSFFWWY
jgi:hypothetical protein